MKLTKLAILVLGLLSFVACQDKLVEDIQEPQKPPSLQEMIQGDWLSINEEDSWPKDELHLNLSDSSFSLFSHAFAPNYQLIDSVLIVQDSNTYFMDADSVKWIYIQEYRVLEVSDSSLVLKSMTKDLNKFLDFVYDRSDTLTFRKVLAQNNIKPVGIEFSCSTCYGVCPSFMVKVTSDHNVKYIGGAYSEVEGPYTGKLHDLFWRALIKNVNYLNLDSLKEKFESDMSHNRPRHLVIYTLEDTIKKYVEEYYSAPGELNILMDAMGGVSHYATLKKDSTIIDSIDFSSFLQIEYAPDVVPPPPPSEENKNETN